MADGQSISVKVGLSVVLILAIFGSFTLSWQFDKEHTSLYKDGKLIAREKWFVEAERTWSTIKYSYQRDSCERKGGEVRDYESSPSRCYYPNDFYEQLKRSLLRTKIDTLETDSGYDITKTTPSYAYGTTGSYAGVIMEKMNFVSKIFSETEFPLSYQTNWSPRDTRNYKLIWRVENLKDINIPNGIYDECAYEFGDILIDLKDDCNKLDYAEIKDGTKIWFHFLPSRGRQSFDVALVDPEVLFIRSGEGTTSAGGTVTTTFTVPFDNNSYTALGTSLEDADDVYSIKVVSKDNTSIDWEIDDDAGGGEAADFMYTAIQYGAYNFSGIQIECGMEGPGSSTSWDINFQKNFTNTSYAAICNPPGDTDSPICIHRDSDQPKAIDGFGVYFNDDGGSAESVSGVEWCVFQYGEYGVGDVTIKSGQATSGISSFTQSFNNNFTDTNYVVMITDASSFPSDGCSCEVTSRLEGEFTATCSDDSGSTGSCNNDEFDWVAITSGDFNATVPPADTTPPVFTEIPHNRTLEYYVESLSVQVNATDDTAIDQFYINDTTNFNISFDGSLINNTLLSINGYYLTIFVNDTSNNTAFFVMNINVTNSPPTQGTPVLNTTDPSTNDTNQNLTAYNISTEDLNGDLVKNIFNWQLNGSSILLLNMPFEGINSTDDDNAWDYSTYGNNGSEIGETIWNATGGYDGRGAYEFNGTNYILIPDNNLNFTDEDFSISFWMKPKTSSISAARVFSKATANNDGYELLYTAKTNTLTFRIYSPDLEGIVSNAAITTNAWNHVVIVKNGASLSYYINGAPEGNNPSVSDPVITSVKMGIGIRTQTETLGYNGTLDEFQVWNRSLSTEQILALYNNQTDLIVSNETNVGDNWSITITPNDGNDDGDALESNGVLILDTEVPCTYSSGSWDVDFADNCVITTPVDLGGNSMSITGGPGTFTTTAEITGCSGTLTKRCAAGNVCNIALRDGGTICSG